MACVADEPDGVGAARDEHTRRRRCPDVMGCAAVSDGPLHDRGRGRRGRAAQHADDVADVGEVQRNAERVGGGQAHVPPAGTEFGDGAGGYRRRGHSGDVGGSRQRECARVGDELPQRAGDCGVGDVRAAVDDLARVGGRDDSTARGGHVLRDVGDAHDG